MNRRNFLQRTATSGFLLGTGAFPMQAFDAPEIQRLTILHTNDVHSRIEPFPQDGSRVGGRGGAARRASLIKRIRKEESNILLLDAGDIFQGTPYFNFFGGELEFKLMSRMGYDAATIGNHDFDGGLEGLFQQLPQANFPLLIANYDMKDTIMQGQTQPYKTFNKGGIKIGVFGIGIELDGLVPPNLYGATQYLDPIKIANHYAALLRNEQDCDYVICLSHLGFLYDEEKVSDVVLAQQTTNIDLIIGGHTHTFLVQPQIEKNKKGEAVLINQVGWGGLMLGRLDIFFERNRKNHCASCDNLWIKKRD